MTETDDTYNGWTNRETWLVNLWLSNEEASYNFIRELVNKDAGNGVVNAERRLKRYMTQNLRDFEGLARDLSKGDRLSWRSAESALTRVNWQEVADSFKEE